MKDCMDKYKEAMVRDSKNRIEPIKEVCEWEHKLRSFLEGLEMSNIDGLMDESADNLKEVGQIMAENIKSKIKGE